MTTTFFPPHVGGVEYHVLNLSKHLSNRKHEITVLTSLLPKTSESGLREILNGIEVVRVKTRFLPGWPYPSLSSVGVPINVRKTIVRLIKEKNVDIIHTHGHHYSLTWTAINTAYKLGLPSVLTLHGMYALNPTNLPARAMEEAFNLTVFRRLLKKVTAVIGLTPTITEYAKKYDPETGKYYTIPNGVDVKKFVEARSLKEVYRQKYQIPRDKMVLLFRGRFTEAKGVLAVVETARQVVRKHPNTYFLFIGGGPLRSRVEKRLKADNLSSYARILDWTPQEQIHELYAASDIFLLPSKWEALPITLLEAMASQLFIIATSVGGIPDVLRGYRKKIFIDECNGQKLLQAINQAIEELPRNLEVRRDLSRYLENFSWPNVANQVEHIYRILT